MEFIIYGTRGEGKIIIVLLVITVILVYVFFRILIQSFYKLLRETMYHAYCIAKEMKVDQLSEEQFYQLVERRMRHDRD